ncbi:MAG: tannase/feruloyl esterase family alpha/beta hydrolase [Vicinamibacteria bacterium]
MRNREVGAVLAVLLGSSVASAQGQVDGPVAPCAILTRVTIPNVTIGGAADLPAGSFAPSGGRPLTTDAFCRVEATASPSPDSSIRIEVWIPAGAAWNGKLLGVGNGGYSGSLSYPAMAAGLARGYAVVSTDTGHAGDQVEFANGHPERLVDWAYRAVHVMTDVAKVVIRAHRGRFPEHAYFHGCSTGGQQALSEAQRFPADYDGIVTGDPGHNRARLILGFLWSWNAMHAPDGQPILPAAKLPLLNEAAVAACDSHDGLTDGLIGDPAACLFDPSMLRCRGAENDRCLTEPQVEAVAKVYVGARNPRTGEQIFSGWARGSERGWGAYIVSPSEPVRLGILRLLFSDPAWNPRSFDWDRDTRFVDETMPFLSANSADLKAFKGSGGKLVMYTGLADPVVPPQDTIRYYESVTTTMGGVAPTQSFFRFFPVPGMGHCSGGAGPSTFDALGALEAWVERAQPPDRITASHLTEGKIDATRPLCPYPTVSRYSGRGSASDGANYACVAPARGR